MKTLVILHGWQSSKEKWEVIKQGLENKGITVIVPDIPGFKKETELTHPWNLNNYLDWFVENIVPSLPDRFILLGHSFGGALATKFVLKYPDKVEKLFLVAAACVRKRTLKRKFFAVFSKIFKKLSFIPFYSTLRKGFYKFVVHNNDYLSAKGFLEDTYLNIIREDLSPVLPNVKKPTVLIWGTKDEATPLRDGYFINKAIEGSKMEIIKDGDHNPHKNNANELIKVISENI